MTEEPRRDVTVLIEATARREPGAAGELLALVYGQLHGIARARMREERRDHTLQATALVHEAYLRLVGDRPVQWSGRAHFFHAAAEAMRRILIEHARARGRLKRGGSPDGKAPKRVPLSIVDLAAEAEGEEILALDEAIRRLEEEEPQVAQVVRLRFFAGLGVDETADALGLSPRSVDRLWAYARARLFRLLEASPHVA